MDNPKQLRLPIRLRERVSKNDYKNVNFSLIAIVSKKVIKKIADDNELNQIEIQIILFISILGIAKINRMGKYLTVKSIHHYYKSAANLVEKGYIKIDLSKSVGRFPAYNYSLTPKGIEINNLFNSLCFSDILD